MGTEFGTLLKQWRGRRRLSQMDLALDAGVSPRHISFIETGRAKPSRAMILGIAETLAVSLRERNALLLAAGFAPAFSQTDLQSPELSMVRTAIEFTLKKQEPYPALVLDRLTNVLDANRAALNLFARFLPPETLQNPPVNVMRITLDPAGMRPYIQDWDRVARHLLRRMQHEVGAEREGNAAQQLMQELRQYPGVPELLAQPGDEVSDAPMLYLELARGNLRLKLFSAIATFGAAQDITLENLRIETVFPANGETKHILEAWGGET